MPVTDFHLHSNARNEEAAVTRPSNGDTGVLQRRIDQAASVGGGEVRVRAGVYTVAGLTLRSGVTLFLERGAVLQGGADLDAYGALGWRSAMILAENVQNAAIAGEGMIDGRNICRPGGEEGFRGFHALAFYNSDEIQIRGITLQNAGNYAVLCQNCHQLIFEHLCIRGGHDGIHIQQCRDVSVTHVDFRTGDDCLAGTDNQDVCVEDCYFNTACNAFRLGALRLTVRRCVFQGPGEFPHQVSVVKSSPRFSMGAAFIHFSPTDRNPTLPSDEWLIEDCRVDQCEALYLYNFQDGLWQTGQPARNLCFRNIRATRMRNGIQIVGDADRSLRLHLHNVRIELDEAHGDSPVLDIDRFDRLKLEDVSFANKGDSPLFRAVHGRHLALVNPAGAPAVREFPGEVEEIDVISGDF